MCLVGENDAAFPFFGCPVLANVVKSFLKINRKTLENLACRGLTRQCVKGLQKNVSWQLQASEHQLSSAHFRQKVRVELKPIAHLSSCLLLPPTRSEYYPVLLQNTYQG